MATSKTRARVITTTELGAIRFKQLLSEEKWLVEFRHADGMDGALFGVAAAGANHPKLFIKSVSSTFTLTDSFIRAPRGEWRLVAKVPAEEVEYSVTSGQTTIFEGKYVVVPPDAPLENSRLASSLKARSPSGAVQRPGVQKAPTQDPGWPVDFVFNENVIGVRDVYVVLEGSHSDVKCEKVEGDGGRDKYVGTAQLLPGPCRYRFRIVFREKQNPESAPLTRLGYDSGVSLLAGLVTWEFTLCVNDLRTGAQAESFTLDHQKGSVGLGVQTESSIVATPPASSVTSGVSVQSERSRLDGLQETHGKPITPSVPAADVTSGANVRGETSRLKELESTQRDFQTPLSSTADVTSSASIRSEASRLDELQDGQENLEITSPSAADRAEDIEDKLTSSTPSRAATGSGISDRSEESRFDEMQDKLSADPLPMELDSIRSGAAASCDQTALSKSQSSPFVAAAVGAGFGALVTIALISASTSRLEKEDDDEDDDGGDDELQRIHETILRFNC